jgi:hypothetical protein
MARKKLYAAQIGEILKRYRAGETQNSLAVAFDVSLSSITATIRRNKAERKLSDPLRNSTSTVPVVSQEILNLRKIVDDPRYGADVRLLAAEKLQALEPQAAQTDEEEFDYFGDLVPSATPQATPSTPRPLPPVDPRAGKIFGVSYMSDTPAAPWTPEEAPKPKPTPGSITVNFASDPIARSEQELRDEFKRRDPSLLRESDIWTDRGQGAQIPRERDPWEL